LNAIFIIIIIIFLLVLSKKVGLNREGIIDSMKTIYCLAEMIELIERLAKEYPIGYATSPSANTFLFRGESDYEYYLRPSIFREVLGGGESKRFILKEDEKRMLFAFRGEGSAYIQNAISDDIPRWLEYARHYGVPTRLLDLVPNSVEFHNPKSSFPSKRLPF